MFLQLIFNIMEPRLYTTKILKLFPQLEIFGTMLYEVVSLLLFSIFVYCEKVYHIFVPRSLKSLDNEIILISGTGNGIGKQLTLQLADVASKATFICLDNENAANEETVQQLRQKNVRAFGFCIDISNRASVNMISQKIRNDIGSPTVVINNAGIIGPTGPFLLQKPESIIRTFEVNLFAHFWIISEFLPEMIRQNHGHIVTIASLAALLPTREIAIYSCSKYGVHGFIESLKKELRSYSNLEYTNNIHFTTVYPGIVQTRISEAIKVSPRFPAIFPKTLSANYVADKTIEAIRRNQEYLYLPATSQLVAFLSYVLPMEIQQKVENGLYRCELEHLPVIAAIKMREPVNDDETETEQGFKIRIIQQRCQIVKDPERSTTCWQFYKKNDTKGKVQELDTEED